MHASPQGKTFLAVMALAIFVVFAYFNTLPGAFIHDDESEIVDNPYIRSPRYVGKILTSPAWAFEYSEERTGVSNYYRPLQYLIYMGIYRIYGLNPLGYHFFKMLLHIFTTILMFFLLDDYFTNFRTALVAAILFALHPIHTEAVTWISGITDALVTPFVLLGLIMYLKARGQWWEVSSYECHSGESRNPARKFSMLDPRFHGGDKISDIPPASTSWPHETMAPPPVRRRAAICYACSIACFFVGLFSKETAVILIPLVILHDFFFSRRTFRPKHLVVYLPYAALFLVYLWFRIAAIGSLKVAGCKYEELNRLQCLLNPIYLAACYSLKALLPFNQNAWYVFHPVLWIGDSRFLLSVILLLAVAGCAIRLAIQRRKCELFFLLWFFITLSPVIVFFRQIGLNVFAERYFYLPGVGFCALVALELDRVKRRQVYVAAVGILAGVCLILTVRRNAIWRDRLTFWSATVGASPDASLARNNLGVEYYKGKRFDEAEAEYREAIRLMYENPTPHINLAMMYQRKKRYEEAVTECRAALQIRPDYAEAYTTLGNIYTAMENHKAALAEYRNALRAQPLNPGTLVSLGSAYQKLGNYTEAEAAIREALHLKQEFPEAHAELGTLYDKMGDSEKAAEEFRRALALKPDFTEARINMGSLYSRKGDMPHAIEELRTAFDRDPDSAEAHYRLGVLYSSEGRFPDAVREYLAALRLDQDHAQALDGLGALLGMAGKYAEAEEMLKRAIALNPDYADAHYNLGILYRKTGQKQKLAREIEALRKHDPRLAAGLEAAE